VTVVAADIPAASPPGLPGHRVQLDGLRAIAVGCVILYHWSEVAWPAVFRLLPWGDIGVELFFVLSGFLITRILLGCRALVESDRAPQSQVVGIFYARRFLRIFPAFYATLALAVLLDIPPARETFWWNATYLSNVYFALRGSGHGAVTHFWSLAVEEQFYLLWPSLVLLTPRRWLAPAFCAAIALGPLWRGATLLAGWNPFAVGWLLPGRIDDLAIGALLAWAWTAGNTHHRRPLVRVAAWVGVPLTLLCFVRSYSDPLDPLVQWIGPLARGLAFAAPIDGAARELGGVAGRFLAWRPVVYIGRISYGVYLLHMFAPWLLHRVLAGTALDPFSHPVRALPLVLAVSIGGAALSWHFYERPLNSLKERFPYP
jgi:peptidoglycan/LPS O-acetylase OafA/YrhL